MGTYAAIGAMIGGTAVSATSARKTAELEQKFYKQQARIAMEEAAYQRRASLEEQHIQREQAETKLSSMRVGFAKAGVAPNLSVLLKAAEDMSTDIAFMAAGRERQAQRLASQAGLSRMKASAAKAAGEYNVWSAILGGAGKMGQFGAQSGE